MSRSFSVFHKKERGSAIRSTKVHTGEIGGEAPYRSGDVREDAGRFRGFFPILQAKIQRETTMKLLEQATNCIRMLSEQDGPFILVV